MPPLTIEQLADSLRVNFIGHAAEIPHEKWRERWLWVNRCAGMVAGIAVGMSLTRGRSREELAAALLDFVVSEFPRNDPAYLTLAAGLETRVLKCLLAFDGKTAAADLLTPKQLRSLHAELQRQKGAAR